MRADPVEAILKKYGEDPSQMIGVLQDLQGTYKYLSYDTLLQMSEKMQVPLSRIYSIATFFKAFSLKPRGEHLVTVCMGTACHVREAPRIVEEISRCLGIQAGETTPDLKFTLQTVNCLGACALGPVMVIDGKYYGTMTAKKVSPLLKKFGR
ncbi:MAG TPA: NAD(P)H-dependent oxidoreductase subunit E [Thermodesulfobacteriota bacterium]|nr:NAD(P)H-dependent oxidoreductase subunit E [Thermodesulfobacteriota bacterium]